MCPSVVIGVGVIRIDRDRFRIIGNGLVIFFHFAVTIAALEINFRIIRIDRDGFGVIGNRSAVFLFILETYPAIKVSVGKIRIEGDGFGIIGDGFIELICLQISDAALVINQGERGLCIYRVGTVSDRRLVQAGGSIIKQTSEKGA